MSEGIASTNGIEPGGEPGDAALLDLALRLRARGDDESIAWAAELESAVWRLAGDRDALVRRTFAGLSINHDVNNALVGILGNAQLLGLGPAGQLPGVSDRLAVILREANRIKEAAVRISELKQGLLVDAPALRPGAGSDMEVA
jgi:signal transduction histidine kinase